MRKHVPPLPCSSLLLDISFILWIYDIPTWSLALLCIVVVGGLAVGGLLLSRHFITKRLRFSREINDAVNYFGTAIAALYSVLLGLIAVASWTNFLSISRLVSREEATIGVLYRDLAAYPELMCTDMRHLLCGYTTFIVDEAWPAQQRGKSLADKARRLSGIQRQMLAYNPPNNGQMAAHMEALHKFNEVLDLRRQRLDHINDSLPGVLWIVVLTGGALTIMVSYFFWIEDGCFHVLLLSMLSLFIALMVFLIAALDYAFRGQVSISADSYRTILTGVMDVLDADRQRGR